jgi:hypothetical protein
MAALVNGIALMNTPTMSGSQGDATEDHGGFVLGNFGIAAQVDENAGLRAHIKINPPALGVWLRNFAVGDLLLKQEGAASLTQWTVRESSRLYPEYSANLEAAGQIKAQVRMFAPLGRNSKLGFLPAIIMQVTVVTQQTWRGQVGYKISRAPRTAPDDTDVPWAGSVRQINVAGIKGGIDGPAILGVKGKDISDAHFTGDADSMEVAVPLELEPGRSQTLTFVIASFDENGAYAVDAPSAPDLLTLIGANVSEYLLRLREFEDDLPRTGNPDEDKWARWYAMPGILLTKGDRAGNVVIMAYRELNQRDTFWASGLHLFFWPDLEKKMIEESVAAQTQAGYIPVTILPLIDHGDDIDPSCLFILRTERYFRWYRDREFLRKAWPAIKRAVAYLHSRDEQGIGLPMQRSYWADWKDVPAVQGRRYAPHFSFLWLAALRAASGLAGELHEEDTAERFALMAATASDFINRPTESGGMWNGRYYVDQWYDGRHPAYVLEDQTVGAFFDVIPPDRLPSIYESLQASETKWGVRETFPYIDFWTDEVGGSPGNYHNGGIWPYWNFVDATGRYIHGRAAEARDIVHRMAHADLEGEQGYHFQPSEYLNGDTGKHRGFTAPGQCADTVYFLMTYFGQLGLRRTSDARIELHLHTQPGNDFNTRLVLPGESGRLTVRGDEVRWTPDSSADHDVIVNIYDERRPW